MYWVSSALQSFCLWAAKKLFRAARLGGFLAAISRRTISRTGELAAEPRSAS
jgi:hypothetical protein